MNEKVKKIASEKELFAVEKIVRIAIDKLPPKKQMIYLLSREECKSYDKFVKQLNISRNTVINQLVKALRYIRQTIQSTADLIGDLSSFLSYHSDRIQLSGNLYSVAW